VGSPLSESFGFLGLSMVCYLVELDSYFVLCRLACGEIRYMELLMSM
jgi:hypothetical protein